MDGQSSKIGTVLIVFGVLVAGSLIAYAWGASSVEIVSTGVWQLEISYQGIYVQAVADAYALDANDVLAIDRLSFICQQSDDPNLAYGDLDRAFVEAEARYGTDPTKSANLNQLRSLVDAGRIVQNTGVGVCNRQPIDEFVRLSRTAAPILLVLMAVAIVGYGILQAIEAGERGAPVPAQADAAGAERTKRTLAGLGRRAPRVQETARSAAARGAQISASAEKTDFAAVGVDAPIVQFMTTYLHGDDLYDDSFSIETASGEFLGETGVGISETIVSGEAKNVTCFEVWLFDKNDIRTVTKVVMSEHAYNDDAIRAKLAPKGEAVLAKTGDKMTLETATLRVQARLVDLSYKSGPVPPNSVFERITIELAAWKADGRRPSGGPASGSLPGSVGTLPTSTPRGS